MDEQRFDNLARGLAGAGWSRRGLARVLTGVALAPLIGWAAPATAKKKKKKKNKKKAKKCKNGAIKCGNACVNPQNDALHCGRCGRSCGINVACVDGGCQGGGCPGDQIACGTLCVDPDDNEQHCGRCHNACGGDLTCINGECDCAEDTRCGNECVDTQTDAEHCGQCNDPCNSGETCVDGQCNPSGCENDEIDCGGGVCIPDGEHPCCNQNDCGGSGQSIQGIVCNTNTHRCECELDGWGICQRFDNKAGICGQCCPGGKQLGEKCAGANDDLTCVSQTSTGCNCPPDKPLTCNSENGGHIRCRANGNDPRACGSSCADCTAGGQQPGCCVNGQCAGLAGCGPNVCSSSCFNARCGSCDTVCGGDTPMCCNRGSGTPAACVAPAAGGCCPAIV